MAAGAGILFLTLHYRGRVTGCVQPADDGLRLHDQKKNRSYALAPGEVYLKPGQLVELQGHKSKNQAGAETFTAQKLIKDLGACGTPSTVTPRGTGTHGELLVWRTSESFYWKIEDPEATVPKRQLSQNCLQNVFLI